MEDILTSWCCPCCAVYQEHLEVGDGRHSNGNAVQHAFIHIAHLICIIGHGGPPGPEHQQMVFD